MCYALITTKKVRTKKGFLMNSITQDIKYCLSIIKYTQNHGVTKGAIKYHKNRQFIYRLFLWYDGTTESLKPKSRRPHSHPKEHTAMEIKLIKDIVQIFHEKNTQLYVLLHVLMQPHTC